VSNKKPLTKQFTYQKAKELSTMMSVEGTRWTKNLKTRRTRELLDQEKGRVKLMWIPSHSGITGNERADEAAKNAFRRRHQRPRTVPTTRPN
jgi:ribonuclease HI